MKVREMHLYSEKVSESEVRNLLDHIVKAKLPLFGFIDFRNLFSINFIRFIACRQDNTIKFYLKERKVLRNLTALLFPYRLSEPSELKNVKGSFGIPRVFLLGGGHDFLGYMMKNRISEMHLRMMRILWRTIAFGSAVDEDGRKSLIFVRNPAKFLRVDLEKNPSIYIEILEPIPKKIATRSEYPVFVDRGSSLGIDNFDPFQHTMVVGSSGTGKSKALYVLLKAMEKKYGEGTRVIILDPHNEFAQMYPGTKKIDFIHSYIEPLEIGERKTPLLTQLTAQLLASSIGGENKYAERVLFYSVHLLTELDCLTLKNMNVLLTDSAGRAEFVSQSSNDEVKRFFDEEFNDIYIHHFNDAVLPIVNFIGEYELYLGKKMKKENLINFIRENRITVISFDPHFFGKRMISFLAGAIMNQLYALAITGKLQDKPTILAIDEFSRVQNIVAKDILIETRKFNLYLYFSIQYLHQLSKEVFDSVVSNIRNIVAFKLSRDDATSVSSIMEIKIEEFFKKNRTSTELEESKKEMFVRLDQRECIVRFFDGRSYLLPMKMEVVDTAQWGWTEDMEKQAALNRAKETEDTVDESNLKEGKGEGAGAAPQPPEPREAPDTQPPEPQQPAPQPQVSNPRDSPPPIKDRVEEAPPSKKPAQETRKAPDEFAQKSFGGTNVSGDELLGRNSLRKKKGTK
ncbi:MAG: DUF87 domain-containing protein [Candidatus Micrarchaeota archaeon]